MNFEISSFNEFEDSTIVLSNNLLTKVLTNGLTLSSNFSLTNCFKLFRMFLISLLTGSENLISSILILSSIFKINCFGFNLTKI